MISFLRGDVLHAGLDSVVLDVGGVGFTVAVPADVARAARVGEEIALHTSLIVREDALSLFGFASRAELDVFGILLGVSGVGPKSALGVLSASSIESPVSSTGPRMYFAVPSGAHAMIGSSAGADAGSMSGFAQSKAGNRDHR